MSAFTGLRRCLRLATRRYRWQALAWMVPLWLFLLGHPIALQRTYPSFEERTSLLAQMRDAPSVRLLFGPLPAAGSVGEFASWEDGGYLLWFVAIMAVMLTTALARRDEQDGHVEVVLGAGAGGWTPFASATTWALGAMALTGVGLAASLIGVNAVVGETPLRGALIFGGVAIAQGWAFTGIALVASQLVRDTSAARGLCFTVFGGAFAIRVLADETGATWLRWLSPWPGGTWPSPSGRSACGRSPFLRSSPPRWWRWRRCSTLAGNYWGRCWPTAPCPPGGGACAARWA